MAGIFADDGITGTNTKKREEFNRMIEECMSGKIDMIITKSISRFARNTLDCLKYIRQLKDKNIAVFFEKENINTMDSKGEIMLTIMASLAQQESQSLSQNVKLGIQYRYQQGEVQVNHKRFLGYTKDENKQLVIDPEGAEVVKRIYREYLEGASLLQISRGLEADGILTAAGKAKWRPETLKKILQNEKYIGDALLQKTYTVDFLSKKRVKNNGIVPQYYVENSHEPIIPRELFMQVQEEMVRRANLRGRKGGKKRVYSSKYALSSIVYCGHCGDIYRRVHWNNRGYKSIVWRCVSRLEEKGSECTAPTINEETLQTAVVKAINELLANKEPFLSTLQKNIATVFNEENDNATDDIDGKLEELQQQLLIQAKSKNDYEDEKIIEQLYKSYSLNGYITESQIFDLVESENVPLFDIEYIMDQLLGKGVIIRENVVGNEEDEDETDYSDTDYEAIYAEVLDDSPELESFIEYVKNVRAPQRREWRNLLPQAQNGNQYARTRVFEMYMRVVIKMALSYSKRYGFSLPDTIQDGMIGLWTAIDKFEYGKNDTFTTYFPFWVRQIIMREAPTRNPTVYFPAHAKDKVFKLYDIIDSHYCELCGRKSICKNLLEEIALAAECELQEAERLYSYLIPFESLEYVLADDDDTLSDEGDKENEIIDGLTKDVSSQGVLKIINEKLTQREKEVILLRYGFVDDVAHTLDSIAGKYGLTRERVRQIESKALRKISRYIN